MEEKDIKSRGRHIMKRCVLPTLSWWLALIFIIGGGSMALYFAFKGDLFWACVGSLFFITGWFTWPKS